MTELNYKWKDLFKNGTRTEIRDLWEPLEKHLIAGKAPMKQVKICRGFFSTGLYIGMTLLEHLGDVSEEDFHRMKVRMISEYEKMNKLDEKRDSYDK